MVQQLFNSVEHLKAEVRRLRGDLNAISTGGKIIPNAINAGVQLPLPIEGAILYGTGVPDWGRLAPPASGDDYKLNYLDGNTAPSWELDTGGGGYDTVEDEGTPLTQRTTMNFVGSGVVVTDSGIETVVTIAGGVAGVTAVRTYISFGYDVDGQSYTP